jgi:hypothetical protein
LVLQDASSRRQTPDDSQDYRPAGTLTMTASAEFPSVKEDSHAIADDYDK